jgi:predicted amidohydrolase
MKFTLALAQIDPVLGDLSANIRKHTTVAKEAIAKGADFVVFPELSLTGYSVKDMNWDLAVNPTRDSSLFDPLLKLSESISILAGGVEEDESFHIFNSAFLFEGGQLRVAHRKIYPPTYGMFEELRYFSAGDSARAVQSKLGNLGVLICEDLWHIALPYVLAKQGAQIILALVASPTRVGASEGQLGVDEVNTQHHKAYARLLSSYIVFCNRVGYEDGVNFWGGSKVVTPDGEVIASAKLFEEDLLIAGIDDNEVRRARRFSRHFLDDNPSVILSELARITDLPH